MRQNEKTLTLFAVIACLSFGVLGCGTGTDNSTSAPKTKVERPPVDSAESQKTNLKSAAGGQAETAEAPM